MRKIQHPNDISSIKDAIGAGECIGNLLWEESTNLITIDTKVVMSAEVMTAVKRQKQWVWSCLISS